MLILSKAHSDTYCIVFFYCSNYLYTYFRQRCIKSMDLYISVLDAVYSCYISPITLSGLILRKGRHIYYYYSSPEPKSICRLSGCVSVWLCVCKHFQTIVTKFYLNLHWGGGKAALGFGPDRIGNLVSMATDSYQGL